MSVLTDVGRELGSKRVIRPLFVRRQVAGRIDEPSAEQSQEDRRGRGCGIAPRAREELAQDSVEAGKVAILAEVEEEDLVEVVQCRLGHHLLGDLPLIVPTDLRDLALVELPESPKSIRPLDQPAAEVGQDPRYSSRDAISTACRTSARRSSSIRSRW
jgi:hypothetical protein